MLPLITSTKLRRAVSVAQASNEMDERNQNLEFGIIFSLDLDYNRQKVSMLYRTPTQSCVIFLIKKSCT